MGAKLTGTELNAAFFPYAFFAALIFAQRARCAAAILFPPAADILCRGAFACGCVFVGFTPVPWSKCST